MSKFSLLAQSLKFDGWKSRSIKVGLQGHTSIEILNNYYNAHLIGSLTFRRMLQMQWPHQKRKRLSFLMKLVTNSQGNMDFSPQARYHFDPKLGPNHIFLQEIANWVCQIYPLPIWKTNFKDIGFKDPLGHKLQLFRQLIDQQNIRFLSAYAQKKQLSVFMALLTYLKENDLSPKLQVDASFHSKYLKKQCFKRQKTFKVEVANQVSEFIFSLDLKHPLVSQWIDGSKILADGSMNLDYPYTLAEQENILNGESFNYGYVGTKGQHRYLDVNQPEIFDVRTNLKRKKLWTSPRNFLSNSNGCFANLIQHDNLVDLWSWDDYQRSCKSNENLLVAKYQDFVTYCRQRKFNLGFADYYHHYGANHWFKKPDYY